MGPEAPRPRGVESGTVYGEGRRREAVVLR